MDMRNLRIEEDEVQVFLEREGAGCLCEAGLADKQRR